ncbi:class I SAM-dependent methyltransferase [Deltaproteobacteria bacterium TL4]
MNINDENQTCPLCESLEAKVLYKDKSRDYFRCPVCDLIFVPSEQFLSTEDEKARYDFHQNDQHDQGYRQFLSRLFVPMQKRLSPGSLGLDFGSGPGPTLSVMFEEAGHFMNIYDFFYAPDLLVFQKKYDFITSTEVVEHLHHPKADLNRLWSCLKPGGILGLMTELVLDGDSFGKWYYKNDPTHVCFFSQTTCQWLATYWLAELSFENKEVILFSKKTE